MGQIFAPGADRRLRRIVLALALLVAGAGGGLYAYERSDSRWGIGTPQPQPIPFPHDLHSGGLKIACRYCHTVATGARAAGMPSAGTCLTCHAQIWRGTPQLEPLHVSVRTGRPIQWTSVSRLPVHVRFHHGAHVQAGVGCATCHGRVETMGETVKTESFSMEWCVTCHRAPERQGVTTPAAAPEPPAHRNGRDLTDCSVCHH